MQAAVEAGEPEVSAAYRVVAASAGMVRSACGSLTSARWSSTASTSQPEAQVAVAMEAMAPAEVWAVPAEPEPRAFRRSSTRPDQVVAAEVAVQVVRPAWAAAVQGAARSE